MSVLTLTLLAVVALHGVSGQIPGADWRVYDDGSRLVEFFTMPPDIPKCTIYEDMNEADPVIRNHRSRATVSPAMMEMLLKKCVALSAVSMSAPARSAPGELESWNPFIYTGTKWCGAGNISNSYDDLGEAREADMCCRDHDHCDDNIAAGDAKHDLNNFSFYTKSSCNCDLKFFNCLVKANTPTAKDVGVLYFNTLGTECFLQGPPLHCEEKAFGWFGRCRKYSVQADQPAMWQFVDPVRFNSLSPNPISVIYPA